jgi:hypothetical protein
MASFNKFNLFVQDMEQGQHDFTSGGGTYNVILTNTSPVATNHYYSDISGELSTGGGYTSGGATATTSDANASGTETISSSNVVWTATGSGFGPFRYAVMYREDGSNHGLVGWWDYGSSVSLSSAGATLTISWASGVFTLA